MSNPGHVLSALWCPVLTDNVDEPIAWDSETSRCSRWKLPRKPCLRGPCEEPLKMPTHSDPLNRNPWGGAQVAVIFKILQRSLMCSQGESQWPGKGAHKRSFQSSVARTGNGWIVCELYLNKSGKNKQTNKSGSYRSPGRATWFCLGIGVGLSQSSQSGEYPLLR